MKSVSWKCKAQILFVALLSGCTLAVGNPNQPGAAPALLSAYESVFYSQGALLVHPEGHWGLPEESTNNLRLPFAYLLEALDALGEPVSDEVLGGGEAVLVGAKDFRAPSGLGAVQSHLCYIVVLRSGSHLDLGKIASKSQVMSSHGSATWKWTVKPTEDQREGQTFYVTQAAQSYLLISNRTGDLKSMAMKLASSNTHIASEVRDWDSIRQHPFWGYRRYRQAAAENRDASGLTDITPTAEALIFSLDSEKGSGILRLVARDSSTAEKLNAEEKFLSLKPNGSDVWQTTIPLSGDETSLDQMVAMMWLFGFGLYL